jgi:ubiquinone/menaquinone biosynthesis C-methylase UbiE
MTNIRAQFERPTGPLGAAIGWLMAIKNGARSAWVIAQLDPTPADRVLEIGFGPGVDIARVAARAAHVSGIDASGVMLRQAENRNAGAIRDGRVDLRLASMPDLPFDAGAFDKAFSVNSFQFWPEKARSLQALRRVMRPGGRVVIAVQPRNKGATNQTSQETGDLLVRSLREAGFTRVELRMKAMKPVATACAIATA